MTSSPPAKVRRPNFSRTEVTCILDQVKQRLPVIGGRLNFNAGITLESKMRAWKDITMAVNEVSQVPRTPKEIRSKYKDMRTQCKAKHAKRARHMEVTNGIPPEDIKFTDIDEAVLELMTLPGTATSSTEDHEINASNLATQESKPSTSTASSDAGLYASVIIDNEEQFIPIRPENPIDTNSASLAAVSEPCPPIPVSHGPIQVATEPETPSSGSREESRLGQILRVNGEIRDLMAKLVKLVRESGRVVPPSNKCAESDCGGGGRAKARFSHSQQSSVAEEITATSSGLPVSPSSMTTPAAGASGGFQHAITCVVCAEQYEQKVRVPLVLPCGHTFCRPCLTDIKKKCRFHCPTCRARHNDLNVEALTVNYSLLSILPLCNEIECNKCDSHGDDLRYWCADCNLPLCSICLYLGHPQGHTVKPAETLVTDKKQLLKEKMNMIFRNIENHKKDLKADFNVFDKRVIKLFERNACLQNTEEALQDLQADVRKANNISSVLYFEKALRDFHVKETNFSNEEEAHSGKTKDSEVTGDNSVCIEIEAGEAEDAGVEACEQQQQQSSSQPKDKPVEESQELTGEVQERTEESNDPDDVPHAVMDYRDGRMLLRTLAEPVATRLSLQMPREVFLELSVGDRCLGCVYIRLWCHLRRAQQFLALCMGTLGPSLLKAKASDKVRNMIVFRSAVDKNNQSVSHALLTGLEWGSKHSKSEAEGLVTGLTSYDNKVYDYNKRCNFYPNADLAFGICTQGQTDTVLNAVFGKVVEGLEVVKEAFQHNPVSEVTITSCGMVMPGLLQES